MSVQEISGSEKEANFKVIAFATYNYRFLESNLSIYYSEHDMSYQGTDEISGGTYPNPLSEETGPMQ